MANTYKNKQLTAFLGLIALLVFFPAIALSQFAGGNGSASSPWQITTKQQLDAVRGFLGPANHFILNNDIAFDAADFLPGGDFYNAGAGWLPIGTETSTFRGKFNGNGRSVSGLRIDSNVNNAELGLFGRTGNGASISNLTLSNFVIVGGNSVSSIGALLGFGTNGTTLLNNRVENGQVTGNIRVGGLVGRLNGVDSQFSGNSADAVVTGRDRVGGLIGVIANQTSIERSYSSGTVILQSGGVGDIGGLVGLMNQVTTVTLSYSNAEVQASASNGGITAGIGGLIGRIADGATQISRTYTTGTIVIENRSLNNLSIGGLVGRMDGAQILNSYAAVTMEFDTTQQTDRTGGLVGSFVLTLPVTAVQDSFWNIETSGLEPRAVDVGISRTTAQMKRIQSFPNWDFVNVWEMSRRTTLPYLRGISQTIPGGPEIGRVFNQPAWRHLGSAFVGMSYAELLESIWTQGVPGSSNPGATVPTVFEYISLPGTCGGWVALPDMTAEITIGKAFAVYVFNADFDGQPIDDQGFPKSILHDAAPLTASMYQANTTTFANCWTHAANSYLFPVRWQDVFSASNNIREVVYVYDSRASEPGYRVWNAVTNTGDVQLNGLIAPFQGFFIQNSGNNAQLNVPASAQVFGEISNFLNRTPDDIIASIGLRAELDGFDRERNMQVVFSTFEADHGLALAPMDAISYVEFAAVGNEGELHRMHNVAGAQGAVNVPLSLRNMVFNQTGWFEESGTFNLSWSGLENFPSDWMFSITDTQTGNVYNLRDSEGFTIEVDVVQTNADQPALAWSLNPTAVLSSASETRFVLNVVTGSPVNVGEDVEIAGEFTLEQNYPNPFNPSTTIRYTLSQASDVRLEVFNLTGQRVATLVNGFQQSGSHSVGFDASNLSSGLYLYRLQAGNQVLSRKMTLVK